MESTSDRRQTCRLLLLVGLGLSVLLALALLAIPVAAATRHVMDSPDLNSLWFQVDYSTDEVGGVTSPNATVWITVSNNVGAVKGSTSVFAGSGGFQAVVSAQDKTVDIVSGDVVAIASSDGSRTSARVIAIAGTIDVAGGVIAGQMLGGIFPATGGIAYYQSASEQWYTWPMSIDASGFYSVSIAGLQTADYARVWYVTPEGNRIMVTLHVAHTTLRVNQDAGWVDGTTTPNATVAITVTGDLGNIRFATETQAGGDGRFWASLSDDQGGALDMRPGDVVTATSSDGSLASVRVVRMLGVVNAATDAMWGEVGEGVFPARVRAEAMGGPDVEVRAGMTNDTGGYVLYFSPYDVRYGETVQLWYFQPDGDALGIERSALRADIELSDNQVGASTTPGSNVQVTMTRGAITAVGSCTANDHGSCWTDLETTSGERPADLRPGDVFVLSAHGQVVTVATYPTFTAQMDADTDTISGYGPPNSELMLFIKPKGPGKMTVQTSATGYFNLKTSQPEYGNYDLLRSDIAYAQYRDENLQVVSLGFAPPRLAASLEGLGEAAPGGRYVYRIRYRNDQFDTPGVVITDVLPAGVTYVTHTPAIPLKLSGNRLVFTVGDVAGMRDNMITLYVDISRSLAPGSWITNSVEVGATQPDSDPTDNTAVLATQLRANATDVSVNVNTLSGSAAAGEPLVYRIDLNNGGPTGSAAVRLTNTLPLSTTFVRWWPDDDSYGWRLVSASGRQVVWERPCIPGYWGDALYFVAQVDSGIPIKHMLTDTVQVYTANDTNLGNNGQTSVTWVDTARRDLYVSKSFSNGSTVDGGMIVYNVNYGSNSNAVAHRVLLTDTLPAGAWIRQSGYGTSTRWVYVPYSYTVGNDYVWDLGDLLPGLWGNLSIEVANDMPAGTVLTNTVRIGSSDDDAYSRNDIATDVRILQHSGPNLNVGQDMYWKGQYNTNYSLLVRNVGDQATGSVWLTFTYPVSMTLEGWKADKNWGELVMTSTVPVSGQATFWLNDIPAGMLTDFEFWFRLDDNAANRQGLVFTSTLVGSIAQDIDPADNVATMVTFSGPDLFIGLAPGSAAVRPSDLVTYTVYFGNRSQAWDMTSMAGGEVTIIDTLPEGMTVVRATRPDDRHAAWPPLVSGSNLIWSWHALGRGSAEEFLLVARVASTAQDGDVLTVTATIHDNLPMDIEPFLDNNTASAGVVVRLPRTPTPTATVTATPTATPGLSRLYLPVILAP